MKLTKKEVAFISMHPDGIRLAIGYHEMMANPYKAGLTYANNTKSQHESRIRVLKEELSRIAPTSQESIKTALLAESAPNP